jgi:hypothetical protein
VIWAKTEAGRAEMQAKALIKERVQRNLLLLIDGQKSQEMLLANVAGIRQEDFDALHAMGLIEPAGASGRARPAVGTAPAAAAPAPAAEEPAPLDYAHFTETLTRLVSKELGLRGFTLTLAIEKAGTVQDLMAVATRAIEQIRERKGADAADAARRALYGR